MSGALRELLAYFKIEVDDKALQEGHEHVEGFLATCKKVGGIVAEAFAVDQLKEFVQGQIEAGAHLKVMAERLGTSTDELQAMTLAAEQAGVSGQGLATALRFLNRNISQALHGGGQGAKVFRDLGITLKNADGSTRASGDVMGDFADAVAKIPDSARQTEVAMKLLGRGGAELIPLLRKGGDSFREAREQMEALGGGMSEKFTEQAHEAEAANVRLTFAMQGLKSEAGGELIPMFASIVGWLTKGVVQVREFVKHTNIMSTATLFFGTIAAVRALGSLRELVQVMGLLKSTTIFGLNIPILLAAAAALILYAVFDDFYGLLHGNESVIGDTLDELFGIGTAADMAYDLNEALSATPSILFNIGSILVRTVVVAFEEVYDAVSAVVGAILQLFSVANNKDGTEFTKAWARLTKGGADADADYNAAAAGMGRDVEAIGDDLTLSKAGRRDKANARRNAALSFPLAAGSGVLKNEPENWVEQNGPQRQNIYGHAFVAPTRDAVAAYRAQQGATIAQQNNFHTEIHGVDTNNSKAVGDATGPGLATHVQRANDRALTAHRKP